MAPKVKADGNTNIAKSTMQSDATSGGATSGSQGILGSGYLRSTSANTSGYVKVVVHNTVGAGDTYGKLPAEVSSLTPGFTGYDNVTASSDASNVVQGQ